MTQSWQSPSIGVTPEIKSRRVQMKFLSLWRCSGCSLLRDCSTPATNSGYFKLVYTTQVNSAFRAIWLVPQSRDIKYYSPPGGFRVKQMSRETHFIRKWSNLLGIAIKLVLYILKQLFASVSVTSGGYLPRRSGSVNIHHYSPPLLRIIVNHHESRYLHWNRAAIVAAYSYWCSMIFDAFLP